MKETEEGSSRRPGRSGRKVVRIVVLALAAVAVLVLILQNQEPAHTRFLGWRVEMPRFLLLGVVYGLGVVTGWVVRWLGGR